MKGRIPIIENERVPDINFFKKAFKKFETNLEKDYNKIMQVFLDAFNSYPILPLHFSNQDFLKGFEAYRVISEMEFKNLGLVDNKVSSFSHPPVGTCPQQRFNTFGSPVLYAASTPHTAVEEKRADLKNGDTYYISKWQFKKIVPITYILLFYGNRFDNSFNFINETFEKKLENLFRHYTKDKRKSLKYFLRRLTELSLVEKFNNITSAFGHYYFYKVVNNLTPPIGMIVYPSIKKKRDGVNYALNPKLLTEDILVCTEIQRQKLGEHSIEGSTIYLEEIGVVNGEDVNWKKFAYRFESAAFFNNYNEPFLNFEGKEMKLGRFNSYTNGESLTVDEFLYENMKSDILKDIVGLAKMREEYVLKQYNCSIPQPIMIDKTECKKLEFKMKFHYFPKLK